MITERITPAPQLWKPRTKPVRIIFIHATRGGTASSAIDYSATKNWFKSPSNMAKDTNRNPLGYGSSASRIIGPMGEHCIVMDDDKYPTYSGCYGFLGYPQEFCLDESAISYEVAQPTNSTPFTDAQYERLALEVAADCKKYGIPPVMLDLRAGQFYPVPTGITRHDRSANGKKLGKSDPGDQFNESRFLALLRTHLTQEEEDMPLNEEDLTKIRAIIKEEVDGGRMLIQFVGAPGVYTYVDGELIHALNPQVFLGSGSEWSDPIGIDLSDPAMDFWKHVPIRFPLGLPREMYPK
jgi:hypothetical protein